MCTAFVRYGDDYICGFNMDINEGALDWRLAMDERVFAVTVAMGRGLPDAVPAGAAIPPEYVECEGGVLRIHGVNRDGRFANQLNNLRFAGAPFEVGADCVPLYDLVDSFLRGRNAMRDVERLARERRVVNLPSGAANIPDMGMHSLMSDSKGNMLIVEPGNGIAVPCGKYAALSNFAVMALPGDFTPENFLHSGTVLV